MSIKLATTSLGNRSTPRSFRLGCTSILIQSAALLFLLAVYGRWLIAITPESLQSIWLALGPFRLLTDFLNPVFVGPLWFFTLYGVILSSLVLVFMRSTVSFRSKLVLIPSLLLILLAPLAVLWLYEPYQLTVQVKPGYTMQWLTEPQNYFASVFKSAQRLYENQGCHYTLYGWSTANELYYGSDCEPNFWQYNPQMRSEPQPVMAIPSSVPEQSVVTRWTSNVGPSAPHGFQEFVITHEKSTSPDGQMEAAIIQNGFYGPFDIVILTRAE